MTPGWEKSYRELQAFCIKHGHCNVPTGESTCIQLGRWVAAQRHKRRQGKLSPDMVRLLDMVGFEWDPSEKIWAEMFERLKAYAQQHGNCNMPEYYPEDQKLANWVHSQRHKRRRGVLLEDREQKLVSIGFCWSIYRGKPKQASGDPVVAKATEAVGRTEHDEEKLYCLRQGVYVQYNGKGDLPAALIRFMQVNGGELPAYIPLPRQPTTFTVGDGYAKDRKISWPGKGPLPGLVMEYVAENGHLPRHE